jgi:hypothetical protein
MSTHEQTTPVALHGLIRRLLDDHQRIFPHQAELCPLCQDTERTLDLLADELPDEECGICCAPAGQPHADACPGKDGDCPGCAAKPGESHGAYCPVAAAGGAATVQPALMTRTGYRCAECCAKAGQPHADTCPEASTPTEPDKAPIPPGISGCYLLADGTYGSFYPGPPGADGKHD